MKIGAQTFTIRESMKTPEDIRVSLLKLADIGYRYAQLSRWGEIEPELLREYADAAGVSLLLTHTPPERIVGETDAVIREHRIIGANWVGLGMMPKEYRDDPKEADAYLKTLEKPVEAIRKAGLRFCYHNHAFEFRRVNGERIIEHMLEHFSAEQMGIILDAYWVQVAGADVCSWIEKLKGRLDCVHLKDCAVSPEDWKLQQFAPIGSGNMDYPKILRAFEDAGTQYAFVEQDKCYDRDPFDCLKESFDYLHAEGWC